MGNGPVTRAHRVLEGDRQRAAPQGAARRAPSARRPRTQSRHLLGALPLDPLPWLAARGRARPACVRPSVARKDSLMPRSRQETHRSPALSRSARPAVVLAAGPHADPNKDTVLELQLLLEDLGYRVDAVVRQRRPPPGSLVGPGKLEELEALLQERRAAGLSPSVVITADRVPSGQLAYLAKALDAPVLDRTDVILQVFEARARTKLARLEI